MLTRQDLLSLEEYAEKRSAIRSDTIQIKKAQRGQPWRAYKDAI
jgi:hypothetical protein